MRAEVDDLIRAMVTYVFAQVHERIHYQNEPIAFDFSKILLQR
jgi:hypothetical protein